MQRTGAAKCVRRLCVGLGLAGGLLPAGRGALGQVADGERPVCGGGIEAPDHGTPVVDVAQPGDATRVVKSRAEMERELRKLRATHFGSMRNVQIRQTGLLRLRDSTDPAIFPALLKIFEREDRDVRGAIIDHLLDQRTEQADAALAWGAIFDRDEWFRGAATGGLVARTGEIGVSDRIKWVIREGLKERDDDDVVSAANLAQALRVYEAIPALITAQLSGRPRGGGGGGRDGALAYIVVGQQQAFVADLTPVVADNAVGFDPQLGVLTTGTVVRVMDAVVVTYRVEIHDALVRLSSAAWGRSTSHLGWDQDAWRRWYTDEFVPHLAAKRAEEERERDGAGPGEPEGRPPG